MSMRGQTQGFPHLSSHVRWSKAGLDGASLGLPCLSGLRIPLVNVKNGDRVEREELWDNFTGHYILVFCF